MGMYTQLVLNVDFKSDTPDEVVNIVKYMTGDCIDIPEHSENVLFKTDRWVYCLVSDSYYFMGLTNTTFGWNDIFKAYQLTVNANCKNYDYEYQKFLDYIQPYIEREGFLGFIQYEEDEQPTLIYNTEEGIDYMTPKGETI